MSNPVIDAIKQRRSIRKFINKPLEKEMLEQIILAGRYAPSAKNDQPWRFIVITKPEKIHWLSLQVQQAIKHVLKNNNGRIILSAGNDKTKFEYFKNYLAEFMPCFNTQEFLNGKTGLLILHNQDREKLTIQEIEVLEHIDLLVIAAHERVNWSVGLEMPTILLTPHYGSFARQNHEFTIANALAYENPDIVRAVDSFLNDYHNQDAKLISSKNKFATKGASNTAQSIINLLEN